MKSKLLFPSAFEATVSINVNVDGQKRQLSGNDATVEISPAIVQSRSVSNIAYLVVEDDEGQEVSRGIVRLSDASGCGSFQTAKKVD